MSKDSENNNFNNEPNNFGLPEGYFQKSANSIFNKIEWIEEHKEFVCLSEHKNIVKQTGFVVPQGYFDRSESKLELIAYTELAKQKFLAGNTGYIVPKDYFESFEVKELVKVLIDDKNELAPFTKLSSIKKQNCFNVKQNYFSDSEQRIISALTKNANVISLFKPKIWLSAVAAVLTIVLSLWAYNQYFKPVKGKDCGSLACLDKKDLVKVKNLESLDNDELYELVNTKKLKEKLEKKSVKKIEKQNNDSSLKNVSTDELLDEI